ncbi:hypothetical protein D3C87_1073180 [compost metagenome]
MGKTFFLSLFGVAFLTCFQVPTAFAGTTATGGYCESTSDCTSGNTCVVDSKNGRGTKIGSCRLTKEGGSPAAGVGDPSACVQQADALLKKCQEEQLSATDSCDSKKDSGMNAVINTASPFALAQGANTASSIQAACQGMAGLSQAANAALAAYRLTCNNWIGDCVTSCTEVKEFLKENGNCVSSTGMASVAAQNIADDAYDLNRSCASLNSRVSEADQAIANYTQTALNSTQCASLTSSDDYLEKMCAANPNLIACKALTSVDCTSSTMATNKVCVCAKNPLDPTCSLTTASNGNGNAIKNGYLDTTGGSSGDGSINGLGDLPDIGIEQGALNKNAAGAPIDGKQGGGAQLGGGGKAGGVAGAGGSGGAGDPNGSQVNAGFYGGGGGGGFGSGGSGYRGNGTGGQAGTAGAKQPGGPDLRQFLPGAKYDPKARGLAGVSGPDGITGPNSSIWKKIQNRYQVMGPSLLP